MLYHSSMHLRLTLPLGEDKFIPLIDFHCFVWGLKANYLIIDARLMQNSDFCLTHYRGEAGFVSVRAWSDETWNDNPLLVIAHIIGLKGLIGVMRGGTAYNAYCCTLKWKCKHFENLFTVFLDWHKKILLYDSVLQLCSVWLQTAGMAVNIIQAVITFPASTEFGKQISITLK